MGQVRTWHAEAKDIFNCKQGKKIQRKIISVGGCVS